MARTKLLLGLTTLGFLVFSSPASALTFNLGSLGSWQFGGDQSVKIGGHDISTIDLGSFGNALASLKNRDKDWTRAKRIDIKPFPLPHRKRPACPVPEPTAAVVFGAGLLVVGGALRRPTRRA